MHNVDVGVVICHETSQKERAATRNAGHVQSGDCGSNVHASPNDSGYRACVGIWLVPGIREGDDVRE